VHSKTFPTDGNCAGQTWESDLRVLYFSRDYSPHDERFLTALGRSSHQVHFLRLSPSRVVELPAGISEVKFTTPGVPIAENERVDELIDIISRLKPDVLHAGPLHGPAYLASLTGFSPLASMSWGADILHDAEVHAETREKIFHSLESSTIFIGDCQAVVDKAVNAYGFPREHIYYFPWGVDLEHFSPAEVSPLREILGWRDNFVFLSNRSFEEIYGVDVVMRAFIQAQAHAPDIRLLLYGRGSREREVIGMAEEAGVLDKIHFAAFIGREDLPASYQAADVFVSASHCDGSSVSLMEALACGKPALVSNIAGNLEWVRHGENGWVFKDGSVQELAAAMEAVSRSAGLAKMGRNARALAEEKADWRRNFPVLLQAYEAAIELQQPATNGGRG